MSEDNEHRFSTSSDIDIKREYTTKDLCDFDPDKDLGKAGEYPFTRGVYPSMFRGKSWTMRQYAGFGTAVESNQRYKYLLQQGQTGLSVAFDLPTQLGFDSDHSLAQGEVGKVGVAVDSLQDMETLFQDIPLDQVSVSMTINATAAVILSMYLALAKKRGIEWTKLSGTIQNDILKEYVARGTYIYPPAASMRIITDILAFSRKNVPNWNTMSISGYHIREAGATAVQELAFTFANAIAYLNSAIAAGMEVDSFAPRLSFFLAAHNDFFEEIAKFRAARRIWAKLTKNKFSAKDPKSWKFRFHTQTSGATLIAQEPDNNVVRVSMQALAAVLGGTQSLHTNSRDEALALPSQESARIALRTQQIIAHESGVTSTVDPLGGSYFIESLTQELETRVDEYLDKIEAMGGVIKAIEKGFIQKEIQDSAYIYQKQIEDKQKLMVGLNAFSSNSDQVQFDLHQPPEAGEKEQVQKLQRLRSARDQVQVAKHLQALSAAAENGKNLLPVLISAVEANATLGEISDTLRKIFGTYTESL